MTTDILARAETELSAKVMVEVGGLLGRRRMSQADFARLLKVKPMWISDRFTGRVKLTVEDMDRMARALGVEVVELLPRSKRAGGLTGEYEDAAHPLAEAVFHPVVPKQLAVSRGSRRTAPTGR